MRYKFGMHVLFRCILCNTRKGDEQLEDQTWQKSDLRGNSLQLKATAAGIAWGSHYKKCRKRLGSAATLRKPLTNDMATCTMGERGV